MLPKKFDFLRMTRELVFGRGGKLKVTLPTGAEQRAWVGSARVLTATTVLTAEDNGATLFLNSATEFETTLPAPFLNGRLTFIVAAAPASASYTIVSSGSGNVIKGSVMSADLNAASDGDIETTGGDTITLVDAKAVASDRVELWSDGTTWFAQGFVSAFDAMTITTAS
jgi:hypothetical protein